MKNFQNFFSLILLTLFSLFILSPTVFSQIKSLPDGLDKDSTFEEIAEWLNKNGFFEATVGIESDGNYNYESDNIPDNSTTYSEEAVFASGFRLDNGGTCKRLDLVNDNMRLIEFGTKYPDPTKGSLSDFRKTNDNQKVFSGELRISLEKLNYKGGKKTKQKKSKNKALFWYSTYEYESDFGGIFKAIDLIFNRDKAIETMKDHFENGMQIRVNGSGTNNRDEAFYGRKLAFRFKDKTTSENFDSAFRQLIKVCSDS